MKWRKVKNNHPIEYETVLFYCQTKQLDLFVYVHSDEQIQIERESDDEDRLGGRGRYGYYGIGTYYDKKFHSENLPNGKPVTHWCRLKFPKR
jgi:hypothetical protein